MVLQTIINYLRPLSEEERYCLDLLKEDPEYDLLKNLIKQKKITIDLKNFNLSLIEDYEYYSLKTENSELFNLVDKTNQTLRKLALQEIFKEFAPSAFTLIPKIISPNLSGLESIKQALTLQLFSSENLHALLIGDIQTGKTELLKSITKLAPHSVFGIGTEQSLVYYFAGNTLSKGLLPEADKGICAIDDLHLMRKDERSNLVSAMDKGFVSINKPAIQEKFDARIRLLASAYPTGSVFSRTIESMKKQIPFDLNLLQKFNLIFLIRQADITRASHSSKKTQETRELKKEDLDFVKEYIKYAETTVPEITIDGNLEKQIPDFIEGLRKKEYKYLLGIPDTFKDSLTKLAKASARMELRNQVTQTDIDRAKLILELSLQI